MNLTKTETVRMQGMYVQGHLEMRKAFGKFEDEVCYREDADIPKHNGLSIRAVKEKINELEQLVELMESYEVAHKING